MSVSLLRRLRTFVGKVQGYYSCHHCGATWNCVKRKTVMYSVGSGMFPLCVECFDKLSSEEIDPYIEQLVLQWVEQGWSESQSPEEVIRAAKVEVRRMKDCG